MSDPNHEDNMAPDLDDLDASDIDFDDFSDFGETDEDAVLYAPNTEEVIPTPVLRVTRMNLNTINTRTSGFAWFSA